jgi:hypothetical protein
MTSILFVCPTQYPVTPDNMNYAVVVFTAVIGASVAYYYFQARKWFRGPGKSMEHDPYLYDLPSERVIDEVKHVKNESDTSSDSDHATKYKVDQVERA